MIYIFDIDGTICSDSYGNYELAVPMVDRIRKNNKLHDNGNIIIYFTARGMGRTNNNVLKAYKLFYNFTKEQLDNWGVRYHDLYMGKPTGDIYVDDKGKNVSDFYED